MNRAHIIFGYKWFHLCASSGLPGGERAMSMFEAGSGVSFDPSTNRRCMAFAARYKCSYCVFRHTPTSLIYSLD